MSTTLKLPYVRFVRRVSSGASLSRSGYVGMMKDNAEALKTAPWRLAQCAPEDVTLTNNQLSKTDGVFDKASKTWTIKPTYTAYCDDCYDAFNQAGDAVSDYTMCGYAGCVAYRFTLPTLTNDNQLEGITLAIQRDKYLRAGVRAVCVFATSDNPAEVWTTIRGAGRAVFTARDVATNVDGVTSFGFLGQRNVPYLTEANPADGSITFTVEGSGTEDLDNLLNYNSVAVHAKDFKYIFVYLTLEDQEGRWNLYKEGEARRYYIEGSAMLVPAGCSFTFAGTVTGEVSSDEIFIDNSVGAFIVSGELASDEKSQLTEGSDFVVYSTTGAAAMPDANGNKTVVYPTSGLFIDNCTRMGGIYGCYSAFLSDEMSRANTMTVTSANNNDYMKYALAGFSIEYTAQRVIMARKKVLLQGVVPSGLLAKKIKLAYCECGGATGKIRYSVWACKGWLRDYADSSLQDHHLYMADVENAGKWMRCLSFETDTHSTTVMYETASLPVPLAPGIYTFLVTAYLDIEQIPQESEYGGPILTDKRASIESGASDRRLGSGTLSGETLRAHHVILGGLLPSISLLT